MWTHHGGATTRIQKKIRFYFIFATIGNLASVVRRVVQCVFFWETPIVELPLLEVIGKVLNVPWQAATTVLLHKVIILKVRSQHGPACLLSSIINGQLLIVAVGTAYFLGSRLTLYKTGVFLPLTVMIFVFLDLVFTVQTNLVLFSQLRIARRALRDGGVHGQEWDGLKKAVLRMGWDAIAALLATGTGTVWYVICGLVIDNNNIREDSTKEKFQSGMQVMDAIFNWTLFLDSGTNDILQLIIFRSSSSRRVSQSLDEALALVQQSVAEQRRRDVSQQTAFADAVEALSVAPLPIQERRDIAQTERHLRAGAATEVEWEHFRERCDAHYQAFALLTQKAFSAYEVLAGRTGYLMRMSGPNNKPQQPRTYSSDAAMAAAELRRDGEFLRPFFEASCGELVDAFNAAARVRDLGLDESLYFLGFDQQVPLPVPPEGFELQAFPISGSYARHPQKRKGVRAHFLTPGCIKGEEACFRKIAEDNKDDAEPARGVCDVVRGKVIFADPYHVALLFALLSTRFEVVRMKNRFVKPVPGSNYRDAMVHFLFAHNGIQQVVELQLALEVLSALQPIQHELYEVVRHETLKSFLTAKAIFIPQGSEPQAELAATEFPLQRSGWTARGLHDEGDVLPRSECRSIGRAAHEEINARL